MSLEKIITTLKKPKEDMSMISINIPLSLKEQLSGIAKEHGFTTNAFLVRMIDEVLNGDGRDKTNLEIVEKLEKLVLREKKVEQALSEIEEEFRLHMKKGADPISVISNDEMEKLIQELETIQYFIKLLKA